MAVAIDGSTWLGRGLLAACFAAHVAATASSIAVWRSARLRDPFKLPTKSSTIASTAISFQR